MRLRARWGDTVAIKRQKWQAAMLVMGPEGRARAESWTKCVVYILTRPRRARKASHLILVAQPHATASPNLLWILASQAPNQTHEPGPLTTIEQIGLALGFPSPGGPVELSRLTSV